VREAIASRSQWNLLPVFEVDAPVEIRPLIDAIDDLLKRLNEDIEAQRRFVANAAHQLRTPLAGLKTQTELAMRQKDLTDLQHILKQVHRSADNVTRLVNQLLSLARLEPTNAQGNYIGSVDLNAVAKEATTDLVPYALNKKIDLGVEEANRKAIVKGDADSIRELLANLIDNAIRYTQPEGKVTVKVICDGDIRLLVEDDGPGIPLAERDKVFERFYRVLGNNVSGSGLGLSIVKEIAQAHRAEVSLTSGTEGKGTVAAVHFPAQTS
jgi:two-component system, OmpR family, sensor histidine kinase TctE